MLLVIDVGNTHTVFGLYQGDELLGHWRMATDPTRTTDESGIFLKEMLAFSSFNIRDVKGAIVSCVVPPMMHAITRMCERYLSMEPLVVGPGIKTGVPVLYENPREVGADRIVNAVAAYQQEKQSCIVVDLGTATTFDYITPKGEYVGGVISPGMQISLEALFQRASKLPRIEIAPPPKVVGRNTVAAMQAGILYGYAGLIDGVVNRIKAEVKTDPKVIATGGLAALVAQEAKTIEKVEPFLTLWGLKLLWDLNKS
ncbi:MAG: type III pantothenate kinase [Bdellovibrionota bacterium]